jgi:hypothetical protein
MSFKKIKMASVSWLSQANFSLFSRTNTKGKDLPHQSVIRADFPFPIFLQDVPQVFSQVPTSS